MKKKSKKRKKIQTRIHRRWWPLVHHTNTSSSPATRNTSHVYCGLRRRARFRLAAGGEGVLFFSAGSPVEELGGGGTVR